MKIIDFHTHAFPDALAARAMPELEREGGIRAALNGTIADLLRSMDVAGIECAVVCSIATKPKQAGSILEWSKAIASDRIIPFPSVHPADPEAAQAVARVHDEGFKGIKLHPYYQNFDLADERVYPIYEALQERGLLLVAHTGFDFAFPRDRICDPQRIERVLAAFPKLRLVTSHLGAWEDWDEVSARLLGKPIYMELSFAIPYLGAERTRELILKHPQGYLLFGTDSPWADQTEYLRAFRALGLGEALERCILQDNALHLLGLT